MSVDKVLRNAVLISNEAFNTLIKVLLEADKALRERKDYKVHKSCLKMLQDDNEKNKACAVIAPPENRARDFENALKAKDIPFVPYKSSNQDQQIFIIPHDYIKKAQEIYDTLDIKKKCTLVPDIEINPTSKVEITVKNDPALLYMIDNLAAKNNLSYSRKLSESSAKISVNKEDIEKLRSILYTATLYESSVLKPSFMNEAKQEKENFEKLKESFSKNQDFFMVSLSDANHYIHVTPDAQCEVVVNGETVKTIDLSQNNEAIQTLYSITQDEIGMTSSTHVDANDFEKRAEIVFEQTKNFQINIDDEKLKTQTDIMSILEEKNFPPLKQDDIVALAKHEISLTEFFQIDESHELFNNFEIIDNDISKRSDVINFLSDVSEKYTYENELSTSINKNELTITTKEDVLIE